AEFKRFSLAPCSIYADEGGLGVVMCDALRDGGWYVSRVNNGAAAIDPRCMPTAALRSGWRPSRLIGEKKRILPEAPAFIQQETNGRVEYTATQKLRVESKEAMRNRGVSSPDTEMDQVWQPARPIL